MSNEQRDKLGKKSWKDGGSFFPDFWTRDLAFPFALISTNDSITTTSQKWRLRKAQSFAQGHTAANWQSSDVELDPKEEKIMRS